MTIKVSRLPKAAPAPIMQQDDAQMIARFFQVLADPTRVRMVKALADAEWCVSDLTEALGMDQPAVSHQLKYLRDLGLVRWTKERQARLLQPRRYPPARHPDQQYRPPRLPARRR